MAATEEEDVVLDVPSLPELDESILVERIHRRAPAIEAAGAEARAEDAGKQAGTEAPAAAAAMEVETTLPDVDPAVGRKWDTIHVRGVDAEFEPMRSEDFMQYFEDLAPLRVQWLNIVSCNVVFANEDDAAAALAARTVGLLHPTAAVDDALVRLAWHIGAVRPPTARVLLRFATVEDVKTKPTPDELRRYLRLHGDQFRRSFAASSVIPADIADLRALLKRPRSDNPPRPAASAAAGKATARRKRSDADTAALELKLPRRRLELGPAADGSAAVASTEASQQPDPSVDDPPIRRRLELGPAADGGAPEPAAVELELSLKGLHRGGRTARGRRRGPPSSAKPDAWSHDLYDG